MMELPEEKNVHNEITTIDEAKSPDCGTKDEDAAVENKDAVGENKDAVGENKDAVGENKDAVDDNKDSVDDNKDSVEEDMDVVDEEIAVSPVVEIAIMHNKDKYVLSLPLLSTISELKDKLVDMIGVPSKMQKIMIKGLVKDDQTLESLNVSSASKIMVVGAKLQDIVAVTLANAVEGSSAASSSLPVKEPLCKTKLHMKVLERGKPDDAMIGILSLKDSLPQASLSGMLNKNGEKVRLTFKLEVDEIWISTKERTKKVAMNTIQNVVSEPIGDHPEYYILGLQLGATESARYWLYWVPAQYIDSIKKAILGG